MSPREEIVKIRRMLIANRGEIAIRIGRACFNLGIVSVAVYSRDDAAALHRARADEAVALPGTGAAAYLDQAAIVAAALEAGCDAVHPGYGFLSENAEFARLCANAGLVFVGPAPETLELFGDKASAIRQARVCSIPVPASTAGGASPGDVRRFFGEANAEGVMIKAVAGGGGRGMREVREAGAIDEAWQRCASEARAAFGNGDLYAEELIGRARHIEVQIVGDGAEVTHLFERECSVQRRHQKIIEIAPSPWLPIEVRDDLLAAAVRLGDSVNYRGVGTVEFLVEIDETGACTGRHFFIELNPRVQVEHTITEEVTGIDIVEAQIRIAGGASLIDLGWPAPSIREPHGFAIQLRVNMEAIGPNGVAAPSSGRIDTFDLPFGPGVRVETLGYSGLIVGTAFDPLLAKVIVYSPASFAEAAQRGFRALGELRIGGPETNAAFLQSILIDPAFREGRAHTRYVEVNWQELAAKSASHRRYYPDRDEESGVVAVRAFHAGPTIDAPMQGQVTSYGVSVGDDFATGQVLAVIEAMKMEYAVRADRGGRVTGLLVAVGSPVGAGEPMLTYEPASAVDAEPVSMAGMPDDAMEQALTKNAREHRRILDAERPEAAELAAKRGMTTARGRIDLLVDEGSFREIGGLVRNERDGQAAPADGVVCGRAVIDGRAVFVISQDFSVFGGSAGHLGMTKMERLAELAGRHGLPLVMLLDGGGHRIQDGQNSRDYAVGAPIFQRLVDLSGWVPVVAAVLGAGFAANTNFCACADFVVMVRDKAVMGIAGPALVKAGTGETVSAQDLGGASMQVDRHGLAHLGVDGEEEAITALRAYLSYLPVNADAALPVLQAGDDACPDTGRLADLVPANTRQGYDVREVIAHVADRGSFFEIAPTHARNIVTGFARMEGRPVGFVANQPQVQAGMLDAPACEKAAHFIAICDAFGLPLVYLIDVPGFSIGSAAERSLLGRRSARMIYELGIATVPRLSVVLRKGYGLGYVAMCGGRSFDADLAVAWPTAEICAMSVEGSVDVAYRKEYEAAPDPTLRRREIIGEIRAGISPFLAAEGFGLDDVIDPADTRKAITETLAHAPRRQERTRRSKRAISPI